MKPGEYRELTDEELLQAYRETRRELFNMRIQQTTGQLETATRLPLVRKDLARINTIMHERRRASS